MVQIGIQLRGLFGTRIVVVSAAALACTVSLLGAFTVTVAPPSISLRSSRVVGAHTQILVDGPQPGILSTVGGTTTYQWLRNGSLLLGNMMTSAPGANYIARRAHLPVAAIDFVDPQSYFATSTAYAPPHGRTPYTLTVASDPSVPMLDVYATAPTKREAMNLVQASFTGLDEYLVTRGVTDSYQLRISQLGHGRVVSTAGGLAIPSLLLRFIGVFVLSAVAGRFVYRLDRDWRRQRDPLLSPGSRESQAASPPLVIVNGQNDI